MSRTIDKDGNDIAVTRPAALERDGWSCRAHARGFARDKRCEGWLVVHHRKLKGAGGRSVDHSLDNLLTLCNSHHRLAHDVRRAEAELCGVIVRSWVDLEAS